MSSVHLLKPISTYPTGELGAPGGGGLAGDWIALLLERMEAEGNPNKEWFEKYCIRY